MEYNPIVHRGVSMVWFRGNVIQIVFPSIGCQKKPKCMMCNYGSDSRNCVSDEAIQILDHALYDFSVRNPCCKRDATPEVEEIAKDSYNDIILLLGTYGSILDKAECNYLGALFQRIGFQIGTYNIKRIILETHYQTVDVDLLNFLRERLAVPSEQMPEIWVEMGFETADFRLAEEVLKKPIEFYQFIDCVTRLHNAGFKAIANVLFGLPTLSPTDQINNCITSIMWALLYGMVDEVTVFPMNIWEGTPLWDMYTNGEYLRPSYYQLFTMLSKLEPGILDQVYISWYGDRQIYNNKWQPAQKVIPPDTGAEDLHFWVRVIDMFHSLSSCYQRSLYLKAVKQVIDKKGDIKTFNHFKYTSHLSKELSLDGYAKSILPVMKVGEMTGNNRIYSPLSFCNLDIKKEDDKHE